MANEDAFQRAIKAANTGKRFPVLSLVKDSPVLAATLSKLVPGQEPPRYGADGNREMVLPNTGALRDLLDRKSQDITDAQTVMQVLPDLELAAQILVSCVLCPKDMTTTELNYSVAEGLLAPSVSTALIAEARSYFEKDYKIKPLLSKILRDMLFDTGSYPVAVIPENTLDEAINGSRRLTMESLADLVRPDGTPRPRGLLGPARLVTPRTERKSAGVSLEAFEAYKVDETIQSTVTLEGIISDQGVRDLRLSVTDNPDVLKVPFINHKLREQKVLEAVKAPTMKHFGRAMEAYHAGKQDIRDMSDRQLTGLLYRDKNFAYKPIAMLKTQEQLNRRTVGNPLVMHLPSESVVPVHIPGSPEAHVGFFVLLDADGHPIRKDRNPDNFAELSSRLGANGSFASSMLNKVKSMWQGFDHRNPRDLEFSARAYGQMIEQDLLARLRNGVYGNGVAIAKREEVWRIMFARALAQQHTQMLFIPAELMTYFAFKYSEDGVGKSLMDDMKIINSLRAMLTFSNVMAAVKNSIGRTEVKVKLDEADPNPQKTIETTMHEIIKSRAQYFPLGMNRPQDLVDYLQRAGFEFTFEGHPGLPDVKVDFGEKATNYTKPDTDLEDTLRKRSIMGMGLSPENVDAGFSAEFATSIMTNNLLLSKRVMQLQEVFTPQLSDNLRKVMMSSETLMKKFKEILTNNFDELKSQLSDLSKAMMENKPDNAKGESLEDKLKDEHFKEAIIDQFLHEFVMAFEVSLPQPNTVTLENQMTAFETYVKALDAMLGAYVSEEFFTNDVGGDVAAHVNTIKAVLRAYFIRQWMAENGVMTELAQLTTIGSDNKPEVNILEVQKAHLEALGKTLTDFMVKLRPKIEKNNEKLNSAGVDDSGGATGGGDTTSGSSGSEFDFTSPESTTGAEGTDTLSGGTPEEPAAGNDTPAGAEGSDSAEGG
jgi:hypothetical protein